MKKGWETKPLGELCDVFADGDWVESKDQSPEGIRLIQTGNVGEGVFKDRAEKARYISEETFKRLRCTEIVEGDCLISRLPDPVGRSCILPDTGERMITAVDCTIVRFKPKQVLPEFFNLYSQSDEYLSTVAKECTGTTRSRISRSNLGQTPIPVPPLVEQRRIVGVLDEAFAGLATAQANAEKNLQNARALFESHLQSVFTQRGDGWVEKHLKEVCEKITDGTHQTPKYFDEGIVFLSSRNVTSGTIDWDRIKYIDTKQHLEMHKRVAPRRDDILLAKNGTTGVAAIVDRDTTFDIYVSLALLRALPVIRPRFLLHFINSPAAKIQFNKRLKGVGVPNLHLEEIREVRLSFPAKLKEQDRIVSELDAFATETQRLARLYEQKQAALAALKKSLLHQAFTGELTHELRESKIIQFPVAAPNITTTDLHAGILAMAFQLHEKNGKQKYYGHVKAEKIAHMIETHVGIDLERDPIKDAAGPNDYTRFKKKVEPRAKKAGYFEFKGSEKTGYKLHKLGQFDSLIAKTRAALGERNQAVDDLLSLMLPMDTQQAEIFSTVYAAWNNLLIDKESITDEAIVLAARENWHPDKLKIPREKFFGAIAWIREKGICPEGKGKKVLSKAVKKRR